MSTPLNLLIAEDNPADVVMLIRTLRKADFDPVWQSVDTEADFCAALNAGLDLVISDYQMPQFTGLRALELTKAHHPGMPFIIVSGTIGEETAVESMRLGATDYLLKDRLARLAPAINRALEEGRLRRDREMALGALRLFRTLVDQSSDAFEVIDLDSGRFIDFNERECRDLGYTRKELLTMGVADIDPTISTPAWAAFAARLRVNGQITGEGIHRRKDGSVFPIEYIARLVHLEHAYVVTVVRNITDRKQAEEALRLSEERFRQMAENIDEVFWMTDTTKNQMLYISPGYERIWGRRCEELYTAPQTWIEAILPEDRDRVRAAITRQVTGDYREEYRIRRPDGSVRWIYDRAFPIKNAAGTIYRVVGVAQDITESKKLEEQFLHAQRMEAVGTLAGGVAHDLNNILAPIMMVAGLLKLQDDAGPKSREMLSLIERSGQRGADIIRQLLTFCRSVPGERCTVQPKHLVREMAGIIRETFPRNITFTDSVPPDLWTVEADPTQLHQVIMNLCVNARDAMPAGGNLKLIATNVTVETTSSHPSEPSPGRYVVLEVTDTGSGISAEIIGRIFEPFFTTKGVGKGTGLGLSTVVGIVKGYGGTVTVESELDRGTTFRVFLPASGGKTDDPPRVRPAEPAHGRNELILLVDDEAPIRETGSGLLERHGYRVLTAASGEEAVRIFIEYQNSIRLVLTDIMMPGMGGVAMIRALQMLRPTIKVVATSGLGQSQNQAEIAALGVGKILAKPFTPQELLEAITQILAI